MVKKQVEETLAKLNAQPDDDINCGLAGVVLQSAPMRAPSTASESTSPAEQINTGFTGTSGRTSSRPPAQVRRDEEWAPSMNRVAPMSMEAAAANRGRWSRRDDDAQSTPVRPTGMMGVAKNTTPQSQRARSSPAADFSTDDDSSLRPSGGGKAKGKGKSKQGKRKSDKAKCKGGTRQDGSRSRPTGGERTRSPPTTRQR